mgnify:CR=1 FL=1
MAEMLKIDHICKTFNAGTINEKVALNGVDLTLEDGDFVTVIGGNGAGKSTTLNAVAGVWPVDSGKIFIGGDDVTKFIRIQTRQIFRPCLPGSYDRNCNHHVHRGKYGNCSPPWQKAWVKLGNHEGRTRHLPGNVKKHWI